jgi:hypothetical protein
MSCCGSRRAALNQTTGLRSAPLHATASGLSVAMSPGDPAAQGQRVALTYSGPVPMVLPSPSGGRPYAMQEAGQSLTVDARDAVALLHTGLFSRA